MAEGRVLNAEFGLRPIGACAYAPAGMRKKRRQRVSISDFGMLIWDFLKRKTSYFELRLSGESK
jgi:hypothetical protein